MKTSILLLSILFAAAHAAAKSPTACEVLSAADVKAVQGQAFVDAKLTQSQHDGVVTSQCFYQLPLFVESISVDVIRSTDVSAEELWQKITSSRGEEEEEEESGEGESVAGLGEETFWVGNAKVGALYVLKDGAILRISVGGAGTQKEKMEKLRKLAERAMARM